MHYIDEICNMINTCTAVSLESHADEDWHYPIIVILLAAVVFFCCAFFLWKRKIHVTKNGYDISMSKLGKMVALYDIKHSLLYIPEVYAYENGLPVKVNMPDGFLEIMKHRTDDENLKRLEDFIDCILSGRESESIKIKIRSRIDKKTRWLELDYYTFMKKGKPHHAYISFGDSTVEHARLLAFERFRLMTNSTGMTGIDYSLLDVTDDCIDVACGMLMPEAGIEGLSIQDYHEELRGVRICNKEGENILDVFSRERLLEYYEAEKYVMEDTWEGPDLRGNKVWFIMTVRLLKDTYDGHIRCYMELKDVTDMKLEELRLKEQSLRDGMTGLYNPAATREIIGEKIHDNKGIHIMAVYDLDSLKKINDTFGHPEGDRIIKAFAERLTEHFDENYVIGRLGGDEFAVYINCIDNEDEIRSKIESFMPCLDMHILEKKYHMKVTCSGGAVSESGRKITYTSLYKKADAALYEAKKKGKNNVVFYDSFISVNDDTKLVVNHKSVVEEQAINYIFEKCSYDAVEDIFIENDRDALILVNQETFDIDYINMKNKEDIDTVFPNWQSRKCYEIICNKEEPCKECRRHDIDRHVLLPRAFECSRFSSDEYVLLDRVNIREHHDTHLHFLKNTTDENYVDNIMERSNKALHLLRYCMDVDMRNTSPERTFKKVMDILCEHLGADLGYVAAFHNSIDNVICRKNGRNADVYSDDIIEGMYSHANSSTLIYFDDCETALGEREDVYNFFKERGTKSLAIFPISAEERIHGYICIENFSRNQISFTLLYEIAGILANCIVRQLIKIHAVTIKNRDSLTGCLNYEGLINKAQEIFSQPDDLTYGCWTMAIKNYRELVHKYGEIAGNRLVVFTAEFIESGRPEGELFCRDLEGRFSGMRVKSEDDSMYATHKTIKNELNNYLKKRLGINDTVDVSCGVCFAVNNGTCDAESIIVASIAMEKKAEMATGSCLLCSDEITYELDMTESLIGSRAYDSLKQDEFELYFQPKLKLETRKKEYTIYAEALARLMKDDRIYSMPSEFIPLLKRGGKLVEFDLYIFEKVCRTIADCMDKGITDIVIAVNMTEATALSSDIFRRYEEIRKRYGVPASYIEIEVSEEVLYDNVAAVSDVIEKFHNEGYLCTLDDFGVEKSTLYLLPQLLVDAIKLDKKFFRGDINVARQKLVIKNLLKLADDLDIAVICEGVEKQEEIDFLFEAGCEYVQGYYHRKPMRINEFMEYINDERKL